MPILLLFALLSFPSIDSRPFGGYPWSHVNHRSIPTVFKTIQGSRYGFAPLMNQHLFGLDVDFDTLPVEKQQEVILDETKSFLNPKPDLFHMADQPRFSIKNFSHDLRNVMPSYINMPTTTRPSTEPSPTTTSSTTMTPPEMEEFTADDEAFLLRHLAEGLDLEEELENLLYPRGDDGFKKRKRG